MASESSAPVKQLAREAEVTRQALTVTVGELNNKISGTIDDFKARMEPAHIKEELTGYVRDESSKLVSAIKRKAYDNPLEAVAVGAAIVYPFWNFLKKIPVPMLLIGGGIWLSKQKNGTAYRAMNDGAYRFSHVAADLKTSVKADVDAVKSTIGDTIQQIMDSADKSAGDAAAAIKDGAQDVFAKVSASAADVGQSGARLASNSRTAFDELISKNPLMVGGIALAIGAFIAASLPGSDAEDKLFGDGSEAVKDKARQATAQGVEQAKDAAADIVGDIAAAAAREGFTREAIPKTIEGVTNSLKAVVDRGLGTALGSDVASNPSGSPTSQTETST